MRLAANTKGGYLKVTRDSIAASAGVACGSVSYHYENLRKLQAAMVAHSIETENVAVFTQALVARHPLAVKAPQHLKDLAARALAA